MDVDMHDESDQEIINQRPPRAARRLTRNVDDPEEVEGSVDLDADVSDEDFNDENSASDDQNDEEEPEDGFVSEYAGNNKRIHAKREVPYWDQSR